MINEVMRANRAYTQQHYRRYAELFSSFKNILLYNGSLIPPIKHDSDGMPILETEDPAKKKARDRSLSLIREPKTEEKKTLEKKGWILVTSQVESFCLIPQEDIVDFRYGILSEGRHEMGNSGPSITIAVDTKHPIRPMRFWSPSYAELLMLEKQKMMQKEANSLPKSVLPALAYFRINPHMPLTEIMGRDFGLRCAGEAYLCGNANNQTSSKPDVFPCGFKSEISLGGHTNVVAFPAIVFKNLLLDLKR